MKIDATQPLEYGTEENRNRIFGFWLFLGAEIALFATLFTVYFVLVNRFASGPSGAEIFEITPVLLETFLLLTSAFTIGLAVHAMRLGLKADDDLYDHHPAVRIPRDRDLRILHLCA